MSSFTQTSNHEAIRYEEIPGMDPGSQGNLPVSQSQQQSVQPPPAQEQAIRYWGHAAPPPPPLSDLAILPPAGPPPPNHFQPLSHWQDRVVDLDKEINVAVSFLEELDPDSPKRQSWVSHLAFLRRERARCMEHITGPRYQYGESMEEFAPSDIYIPEGH